MIGSRDRCGNPLKTLKAVYSFIRYLLDEDHPRHEGMTLELPTYWGVDGSTSLAGFNRLAELLEDGLGYSLAESLSKLTEISDLANLEVSELESVLLGEDDGLGGPKGDSRREILALGAFLSAITALEQKFLGQEGCKGLSLVEQLSVSPEPGVRYTREQRDQLDKRVFSTLGDSCVGLSVWHLGKKMWYKGVETFRDDAHYLLCDYVDGPVVQRRLTALANYRSNNYLLLFQQVLERFVFDMHVEGYSDSGVAAPLESVAMRKPPRVHSKKDNVLDEVLDIVQLEEPSIEEILEMVKPRGWRAGEVERGRSKTKQVALCPPGYNEPVYFTRDGFRDKLLAHKRRRKRSKKTEVSLTELEEGFRHLGNLVEEPSENTTKAPIEKKGPEL